MTGRANWYYNHPPTCTCVDCNERRLGRKKDKGKSSWLKKLWPFSKNKD